MNKNTPSATAMGAAMLRAAHQLIDGKRKLLEDAVILKMIGDEAAEHIRERRDEFYSPGAMALRTHIVLRSCYAEDCLHDSFSSGIRQFLMLGAGMDTFAYRQPEWANELQIVEADHLASQANKLDHLASANIAIPANVSFLKVDLEQDDLDMIIKQSKLDLSKPMFVSCLGVLVYLTQKAIHEIFSFVGALPKGSEFVFTASQKRTDQWWTRASQKVAQTGEPWISHFDFNGLEKQLKTSGFSKVMFFSTDEAKRKYFNDLNLLIPSPQRCSLIRAVV